MKQLVIVSAMAVTMLGAFSIAAWADGPQPLNKGVPSAVTVDVNGTEVPQSTSVALSGKLSSKTGTYFMLDRVGGPVRARIGRSTNAINPWDSIQSKLSVGDSVTVYGTLYKRPDGQILVATDAVYDKTLDHLFLTDRGLERSSLLRYQSLDQVATTTTAAR